MSDARDAYRAKLASRTRADKIKDLEQSVGSLNRRVENAIKAGDTDKAKDLRSRQKNFVKDLGNELAIQSGGVMRSAPTSSDDKGRIIRDSRGNPILTTEGFQTFQNNMQRNFLDPTRRIMNTNPDAYATMYPISNFIQRTLPKAARMAVPGGGIMGLNQESRPIPMFDPNFNTSRDFALDLQTQNPDIAESYSQFMDEQFPIDQSEAVERSTIANETPEYLDNVIQTGGLVNLDQFDFGDTGNEVLRGVRGITDEFDKLGLDFNVGDREVGFSTPLFNLPGNFRFNINPQGGGIMYNLGFGA